MITTGTERARCCRVFLRETPSRPCRGRVISSVIRLRVCCDAATRAASALPASTTVKPSDSRSRRTRSADCALSSTTRATRSLGAEARSAGAAESGTVVTTPVTGVRSGSHAAKREPSPSALATPTVPPCSSASCLTIDRPRPVPSNLRARLLSIWQKGWNNFAMFAVEIPMPASLTLISRNSPYGLSSSGKVCTGHVPVRVPTASRGTRRARTVTCPPTALNLTAFDSRL